MYRDSDVQVIKLNLSMLENKAMKIYQEKHDPVTNDEFKDVQEMIKEFIREKGRVVYGGYAQNRLIENKSPEDGFYNEVDRADIEFYSSEPIKDTINLTNIIKKKYDNVVGKEAVHPGTYKIYVNYINYCDISQIDPYVEKNLPIMMLENLKMAHPHFMLTDAFRVYTDPMTSYYRLTKVFNRFHKLMLFYPFDETLARNKLDLPKVNHLEEVFRFIRKHIIHNSKLVVIGHYAFNHLVKKEDPNNETTIPYYQVISTNFKEDRKNIGELLKKTYGKNLSYQRFYPFFQFFDERIEFYYKNQVILKVYGNNDRCIVSKYSENKKTYFATYQLLILYLLSDFSLAYVNKNKAEEKNFLIMISKINKIKNDYLESRQLNVLDDSPFQEFTMDCIGVPVEPLRASFEKVAKKIKQGKKIKFTYNPGESKNVKIPNYIFPDTSGLEIKNKKK